MDEPAEEKRGAGPEAVPYGPQRPAHHPWRRLVRLALPTVLLLALVRACVVQPCAIPFGSPSMRSTLLEGDVLLVSTLSYHLRSPARVPFTDITLPRLDLPGLSSLERGDVVVFDHTDIRNGAPVTEQYVKRCVAIAGDTVRMVQGRVTVNGREVPPAVPEERRRIAADTARVLLLFRRGDPVVMPKEGDLIPLDSLRAELWRPLIESEGSSVSYRNGIVLIGGLPATRYQVRHDHFFALGDNDANSRDSRVFGPISYDALVGQAWIIYWSRDVDGNVRWSRLGHIIR